MIAQTPCPCCGHIVAPNAELRWNENTRTLSGCGRIIRLTPMQGKIFNKLWKSWPTGHMISVREMMDHVYAEYEDGGPDYHNTISVQILFIRKRIAPLGLNIKGRQGYLIYRTGVEQAAA